jgi:hypothetical protein
LRDWGGVIDSRRHRSSAQMAIVGGTRYCRNVDVRRKLQKVRCNTVQKCRVQTEEHAQCAERGSSCNARWKLKGESLRAPCHYGAKQN